MIFSFEFLKIVDKGSFVIILVLTKYIICLQHYLSKWKQKGTQSFKYMLRYRPV